MEYYGLSSDVEGARATDEMLRDREARTGWLIRWTSC